MRKLIVCNIMSLDGYYTGPGGNIMVMPMDEAFDAYNAERLRAADTLLLGRSSYEGFKGFWPSVADDPNATPTNREISRRNNEIGKVVISDSLTPEQTEPWRDTRIIGLVDELHLMIGPVVVGAGTPMFDAQPSPSLRLIDTRTWDGSGNVLVRYAARSAEPAR